MFLSEVRTGVSNSIHYQFKIPFSSSCSEILSAAGLFIALSSATPTLVKIHFIVIVGKSNA